VSRVGSGDHLGGELVSRSAFFDLLSEPLGGPYLIVAARGEQDVGGDLLDGDRRREHALGEGPQALFVQTPVGR
jgi:hypothetical protein